MTTQSNKLDNLTLQQWIKQSVPIARSDGGGLNFTLSKAGTASWTLRYRSKGKASELTIGNYPDISLAEARKLARTHRAAVDSGANPAADKAAKKAVSIALTIRQLAADYNIKRLTPASFAEGTIYYRNRDLDKDILPLIGKRPVAEVTAQEVVKMLQDCYRSWTVSKRVLTTISNLFDHAAGLRLININPCKGINLISLFGPRPPVKTRVMLSLDELTTLLSMVDTLGTANGLVFRILLATCVRTSELVKAEWKNINLESGNWFVPDVTTKTRNGFQVPLTKMVIDWFEQLKAIAGDSPYVLPARIDRNLGQTIDPRTTWAAIDRAFKNGRLTVTKFTPHDTRSTAKGHMRNLHISKVDTELALSHTVGGMDAIYDVRDEKPEKRDALEKWSNLLASLTAPQDISEKQQSPLTTLPSR